MRWTPRILSFLVLALLLTLTPALAQSSGERNYDARLGRQLAAKAQASPAQLEAVAKLAEEVDDLAVDFDPVTGVGRSLRRHTGFLTGAHPGADAETLALEVADELRAVLGLTDQDLRHYEVTDEVFSAVSGVTHIYLRQTHRNIPVFNGQLHVNIGQDGQILSINNAFFPDLASRVRGVVPRLNPAEAVRAAAAHLGVALADDPRTVSAGSDARRTTRLDVPGLSRREVDAQLAWLPLDATEVAMVWNFQVETLDGEHFFDFTIDADTGEVWTRFDWTNSGSYRVYQEPDESPLHGSMGRTLVVDPEDATASPDGWFTGGTMDGNNVHACPDRNGNNVCDSNPQCAGTTCDFPINLSQDPVNFIPAAVANLFYWNNRIHDIQYQYGFDELAGNFQENNFGRGGFGSDSVNADAQDNANGSSRCNANFSTPTDGGNPRMQMFVCNATSPQRDGDLDNGVIVHEYGHGISIRQVGGPQTSSCLNNLQQAGEGWSDWLGLAYTGEPGDAGTNARGIGSYLFALTPEGGTIRDLPYSTDPAVNNWTYESISGASIPHGVGSRWAQAIWEVYWALVDTHGVEFDLVNFDASDPNEAGNKRAMFYINEGLKNTACSPTFVDNRNGIIDAATASFGGEDVCLLWETFAAFGLGTDAISGGSNSTNPTNGFSIPETCQAPPGGGDVQVGTVTIDEVIRTQAISGFTNPIVVLGPASFNGSQPGVIRGRNVTSTSFQHNFEEWMFLDGAHVLESAGFLVAESGRSTLGSLDIEAGSFFPADHNTVTINFSQAFSSAPVVIAQVATFNGSDPVATRVSNVTTTGFQVRLQEEEAKDGVHGNAEILHWVAVETGTTTANGATFVVGRTGNSVTHTFATINFGQTLTSPVFLAEMQTFDGPDTASLRHQNLTSTSVQVKVEEETSFDAETNHTTEVVGFIAIGR